MTYSVSDSGVCVLSHEAVDDGIEAFERGLRGGVGSGGRGGGIGHEVSLFGSQLENVGRQQTYPGRTGSSSRKGKACGGGEKEPFSRKVRVTDGFHTVTVRRTNGQIYYQQTIAFVSGERLTMVILDTVSGVSLTRVSDMGCTNVPAGYGCLRVANMSYAGSSYDVRTFNNQTAFAGIGYKEVTSYKQTSSGTYTFFVTGSQYAVSALGELPVLVLSSIVGVSCPTCTVANPLLTFNVNVRAGRAYTCYIIGNPWSGLFRAYVLED